MMTHDAPCAPCTFRITGHTRAGPTSCQRFGLRPASHWRLTSEYNATDTLQAIELREGAIPDTGGLVRYAGEFVAAR